MNIEKLAIEHLKQSGWGVKPFYQGNLEQLEAFAKAYQMKEGEPVAKQPWPNHNWCVGCDPENCSGCGTEPKERRKQSSEPVGKYEHRQRRDGFPVWVAGITLYKHIPTGTELYTRPPSTISLEEHNKCIAELESRCAEISSFGISAAYDAKELRQQVEALQVTNKTLLDALDSAIEAHDYREGTETYKKLMSKAKLLRAQAIADAEGVEG